MANEALKRFLVERLIDLDSSLNDSEGSMMYVKVIDPLIKRLGIDPKTVDIQTFILSRLEDEYPQLDVKSPGSVIKDVLVSPLVLILEPLQREIEFLRIQNSLGDSDSLSEEELDALLSNVFSVRKYGDYARGNVRVYFKIAKAVGVDPSIAFSTAAGEVFIPEESFTYSPEDMTRSGNQYYLDIPVRSQEPDANSNVASGQIRHVNGLDGVTRVANLSAFTGGVTKETNEDFLVRAERSLSERSLNTERGIETAILNNFADIVSVEVVGYGEDAMQRDIVQARVRQDFDEDIGPLLYMTANWKTHPLWSSGAMALPFTNTLKIMPPHRAALTNDGGWPLKLKEALLQAKYIRVADGSGLTWSHDDTDSVLTPPYGDSDGGLPNLDTPFRANVYNDPLLNRIRAVDETLFNGAGASPDYAIYIKLKDFDIYPSPPTITGSSPVFGSVETDAPEMGLNKRSNQGSAFNMVGEEGSNELVLGAHLPFTDHVYTNFSVAEVPQAVIPGLDFLVCFTPNVTSSINNPPTSTFVGMDYPATIQAWPLTRRYTSTELGVGRIDSFMVSKRRAVFPGKEEYVFDPNLVFSMSREHIKIIDFGGPKSSDGDPDVMFGGEEIEDSGRNPGCMIQVMWSLPNLAVEIGSWADIHNGAGIVEPHPREVDIILDSSQTRWADRGVSEGHYICCSVYDHKVFDGDLINVESLLKWQGWGRVIKVGAGTPWRLRVEGLDFGPLHEKNYGQFSPPAGGTVTIDNVPQVPQLHSEGSHDSTVMAISIAGLPPVDITLETPWDGAGAKASKTITIPTADFNGGAGGPPYTAGTVTLTAPLANDALSPLAPGTGVIKITLPVAGNHDDWLQGVADKINVYEDPIGPSAIPGFFVHATYSGAGDDVVIESTLYGEYGDLVSIDDVSDSVGTVGSGYGNFENGVAPEVENLTKHLEAEITLGTPGYSAEIVGDAADGVLRIISDAPGAANNGQSFSISHEDFAPGPPHNEFPQFVHSTWNGAQVIHGGFNYGFGPLAQVGHDRLTGAPVYLTNVPNLPYDEPEGLGHEKLSPEPAIDGIFDTYTLVLENTPIRGDTPRIHYWDPGVTGGVPPLDQGTHVIFEDITGTGVLTTAWMATAGGAFAPVLAPDPYLDSGKIDYSNGTVVLKFLPGAIPVVENLTPYDPPPPGPVGGDVQHGTPLFSVGYDHYVTPFKSYWTVYSGATETLSPDGSIGVSYSDFSFPPAYKRPGPQGTGTLDEGHVVARGSGYYGGWRWDGDNGGNLGTAYRFSSSAVNSNERAAFWIRLGKGVEENYPSIGGSPSQKCASGEVIDFSKVGVIGDYSGDFTEDDQKTYGKKRYDIRDLASAEQEILEPGGVPVDHFVVRSSLPIISGSRKIVDPSSPLDTTFDLDEMSWINFKGLSGFLLPHPMGPAHYDSDAAAAFPYLNPISTRHLLDHQVLQVYDGAPEPEGETGIVISGIPGGVPFPGWFGKEIEIESDKIHIGGMTDVYSKSTAVEESTTAPIKLQPEALDPSALPTPSPEDPPPNYEVLVQADDGIINTNTEDATHFDSTQLLSAINAHQEFSGNSGSFFLNNIVIEILDTPSPDLQPAFFRAVHTTSNGVRIDGEFTSGVAYSNIRFRALFGCTTSVNNPLTVLQQGSDLVVQKNDFSVLSPSGFNFDSDPANVPIYISIDSNTSHGEYSVTGKNLNTLITATALPESGEGLSYRVYIKQAVGADLPLVRIKSVSLSGGDTEGIPIPYKNPVDIVASSFAGLNDDPINDEALGESLVWDPTVMTFSIDPDTYKIVPLSPNTVLRACLVIDDQDDFVVELNSLRYDVIRIETLDEPNKHFYVEGFDSYDTGGANTNLNVLVLDRELEGLITEITNVKFVLGRPAVGTAELVFKDSTFIEAGPNTVFSYYNTESEKTFKFRPSPLESAVLYKTDYVSTDLTIDPILGAEKLYSEDVNFLKHGFKIGDELTIHTRVIRSDKFFGQDPQLQHESMSLAGKTLVIDINGSKKTVVFSGPNPTTLEQAVADINRQVGGSLKAEMVEPDPILFPEEYYLQISSNVPVELLDEGTIGVLSELKVSGNLGFRDNTFYNGDLFDPYIIDDIEYVPSSPPAPPPPTNTRWILTLRKVGGVGGTPVVVFPEKVFVSVRRYKHQRSYPTDMRTNNVGLFTTPMTLTSYDPNIPGGLISDDTQLFVENHNSLGYEMVVKNSNYSYSLGEECSIRTTSVILSDIQNDFAAPYPLPGAEVTISYDKAPVVSDIQSFLLDKSLRVVCNNPLSKHFLPAYPLVSLNYGDSNLSPFAVKALIEDFFKTLYPNKPLELYDLSALLARKGVGYVEFPQYVSFLVHDEDRVLRIIRDVDIIYLSKHFHIMEDVSGVLVNKVR